MTQENRKFSCAQLIECNSFILGRFSDLNSLLKFSLHEQNWNFRYYYNKTGESIKNTYILIQVSTDTHKAIFFNVWFRWILYLWEIIDWITQTKLVSEWDFLSQKLKIIYSYIFKHFWRFSFSFHFTFNFKIMH